MRRIVKNRDHFVGTKKEAIQNDTKRTDNPLYLTYSAKEIEPLYKYVAELAHTDEQKVKYAMMNTFQYLSEWLKEPHTASEFLLTEFGRFSLNLKSINYQISKLIPYLRGKDRDKYLDRFKELWRRRQMAIYSHNRKKADGRIFHFAKHLKDEGKLKSNTKT